ncbi:hypothetical protein OS493_036076 [Desmophyllum pertusum]|uniref:Zinc-ribbon domain-containing protein n=1 Tax=Desmophyllum pertusum TaxID=174260 RepID=A0A9W9YY51_9CNID|nr:hypothetical protein OS493_036076 [Desmophyllum pertusum]
MFCSFCGESCVADALFCHKCGKKISAGKKDDSPGSSGIQQTLVKAPEQLLSFAALRSRKEEERAKHFKPSAKKFKTGPEKPEKEVKINIGVLAMKDGNLSVKLRGVTLPLSVSPNINSEDLLKIESALSSTSFLSVQLIGQRSIVTKNNLSVTKNFL